MKKNSIIFLCALVVIVGIIITVIVVNNNSKAEVNNANITISVYNQDNSSIFNQSIDTNKEHLIDVLNDINTLKLVTEDSQYGAYITSIMGIAQSDKYYWSYYIDDEYATVGISSCKVEDGKNYSFRLEEINY